MCEGKLVVFTLRSVLELGAGVWRFSRITGAAGDGMVFAGGLGSDCGCGSSAPNSAEALGTLVLDDLFDRTVLVGVAVAEDFKVAVEAALGNVVRELERVLLPLSMLLLVVTRRIDVELLVGLRRAQVLLLVIHAHPARVVGFGRAGRDGSERRCAPEGVAEAIQTWRAE